MTSSRRQQFLPGGVQRTTHMKGKWHCDYRWRQGVYRLVYEVIDHQNLVHVYHANTRGDVYG